MLWGYLVIRTQMSRLYMANQKSSITALNGFWSMQMFSYNCVSHHNTVKLELLQLVFPSVLYPWVCSLWFGGELVSVWRKSFQADVVWSFQSLKITNLTWGILCTLLCHPHERHTRGVRGDTVIASNLNISAGLQMQLWRQVNTSRTWHCRRQWELCSF